jgi:hypothetical protein
MNEGERLYEQLQREQEAHCWASRRTVEEDPGVTGLSPWIDSEEGRRITFLELMAWAIIQAESARTREQWNKFQADLTRNRIERWLPMPWPGAKRPERFEHHVLRMARAFTTGGRYSARREQPLTHA